MLNDLEYVNVNLCNFDVESINLDMVIGYIWCNDWKKVLTNFHRDVSKSVIMKRIFTEPFTKLFESNGWTTKYILQLASCSLVMFCNVNWSTHLKDKNLEELLLSEWPNDISVIQHLQSDSETIYTNILHPELLYFSIKILKKLCVMEDNLLHLWWYFRSKVTHQRVLEDSSATIYSELEELIAKLTNKSQHLQNSSRLKILLYLEIAQAYLYYGRVQKVEEYLSKARDIAGLKLELKGALGKRTKFQQTVLPQLALSSELDDSIDRPPASVTHGSSNLPNDVPLQDDVRLDKVQYSEEMSQAELPSLEQIVCLMQAQYLQKAQAKDELMEEELLPYIEMVLSQSYGSWACRVAALLFRCKLESNQKRTIERAMMQCEAIVNDQSSVPHTVRLSYLWASGLQPAWTWRQQLADLYLNIGLVKAALEEYQKLQLWEDVVVCYTMLQLRHKAAEVIKQQLEIKPTVKLYCLLGDATDNIQCYEEAWAFSNFKSSRAQRHWGNYLFNHKKYDECIPHFEKSLEINSIQERVWLRLGYAALMTEAWETSANAYRRYTYLQPNSFEAWNNLAKVYVKQGDKARAHRALTEALKFNYDNWKLWENVIIVSIDTGHFDDVIRGIHRILDLQHKYDDKEVLTLLAKGILLGSEQGDENSDARLRKRALELFGRLTSNHQSKPEVWQLYSDISPTYLSKAQRLLKAYKGYTQDISWSNKPDVLVKLIELVQNMLQYSLMARQEANDNEKLQADQQLSSARLTGQAVIRALEKKDWPETQQSLEELKIKFSEVTDYMKSVVQ